MCDDVSERLRVRRSIVHPIEIARDRMFAKFNRRAERQPVLVMDCSFDLMNPAAGRQQYEAQHIPGAVYVDLDEHLSDKTGSDRASGGRHPLPSRETFARRLQALGLDPGMQVVVMDRQGANYCGRLWWMLKWCGHEAVAVLDGGLAAWKAAGGALDSGPAQARPAGDFRLGPSLAPTVDTAGLQARLGRADDIADAQDARPRRALRPQQRGLDCDVVLESVEHSPQHDYTEQDRQRAREPGARDASAWRSPPCRSRKRGPPEPCGATGSMPEDPSGAARCPPWQAAVRGRGSMR